MIISGKMKKMKGFTLIELLIVIGILAILATTVVLVLNPAQILAETRDTQRISDIGAVNNAIGLYLATVANPTFGSGATEGAATGCGTQTWRSSGAGATIAAIADANNPFTSGSGPAAGVVTSEPTIGFRDVDGTGWASAGFTTTPGSTTGFNAISGGSPLGSLPSDPSANTAAAVASLSVTGRFYAFQCGISNGALQYEINANMESVKFSGGTTPGSADVEGTDGGNVNTIYEVGTDPGLDL